MFFNRRKVERILDLQREKNKPSADSEKTDLVDVPEEDGTNKESEEPPAPLTLWQRVRRIFRRRKKKESMLEKNDLLAIAIAAILVFVPAFLLVAGAFYLFIILFFRLF